MKASKTYWIHAILAFLTTLFAGGILLPLARSEPSPVHEFITGLHDWQRIGFIFFLATLLNFVIFKLLTPRLRHLRHVVTHPPAWTAVLLGLIFVAWIDLAVGLDPKNYRATVWEWLGYAGGSLLVVASYCGTWKELLFLPKSLCSRKKADTQIEQLVEPLRITLLNIADAKWEDIEDWLESDAPAKYDFLGNRVVADRLASMLEGETRSVGIVGPYGAGKTSLVNWIKERINSCNSESPRFFVCHHSCWGFETSASSIQDMLREAIAQIGSEIDTFHVNTLPDSYRQTFSAGGEWVDTISKLVLKESHLVEQFGRLSDLLSDLNAKLVFIVEDLDRNETSKFEIQEVLAFLERLKPHDNLVFVLTGGLSSSRQIDFAKLCDHIEQIRTIEVRHITPLILRVRARCLDQNVFCHHPLVDSDRQYDWSPLRGVMMSDHEELSFPQAVAHLLSTPRSLRHALSRSYSAWQRLYGEIDLDQLLAMNVLRFGAPECFQFLIRRWDRLHSPPTQNPGFGRGRIAQIRESVIEDWNDTIRDVEWNPIAALKVMEEILPAIEFWLIDDSRSGNFTDTPQGVQKEKYWLRAINEVVEENDVRDQEVIRDSLQWMEMPNVDAILISKLRSSSVYSDVWEELGARFLADRPDQILQVCEHVLIQIMQNEASAASHDSQGFVATWRFANRNLPRRPENRVWLEARISEAAMVSIEMVNSLWHYYGSSDRYSILQQHDIDAVRQYEIQALKLILVKEHALARIMNVAHPYVLYHLVFDPGDHNPQSVGDIHAWKWLGPVLIGALRNGNSVVAVAVATLVAARDSGTRKEPWAVQPEILFALFPDDAQEVVDLLRKLSDQVEATEQRQLIGTIVESSEVAIQDRASAILVD